MRRFDILIAGGGPAGGMLAWSAARMGRSVVLCEAHAVLPERVCGAYLCPAGVRLLEELGLRGRLTAGCRELQGMIMVSPEGRRLVTHFPQTAGSISHGLALDRPGFDQRWLQLAREAGAEVRMGARVTRLHQLPDGWQVSLADGSALSARLLVGADGRKSWVARQLGLVRAPRRARAASHIDLAPRQPLPPFGQMHVFADGSYVGLNPLDAGRVNVSLVYAPTAVKGRGPAGCLNDRIRQGLLGELIAPVGDDAEFGTTFPATASVAGVTGPRAALIGDASGFIDPLTGEGIYNALWTARALAAALAEFPDRLPMALAAYAGARQRTQRSKAILSRVFQGCIARPAVANRILRLLSVRQGVADAFIGIVGNTHSPARGLVAMLGGLLSQPPCAPLFPTPSPCHPPA